MKNLLTRSLTGVVFVTVIIACIWFGKYSFLVLFLALMLVGMYEFIQLFKGSSIKLARIPVFLSAIVVFTITALVSTGMLQSSIYLLLIPIPILICIIELYRNKETPIENIAISLFSIIYVAVPFSLISLLVFPGSGVYNPNLLIGLFIIIWLYDSFAYLFGVSFGRHRLFERISPKKSWEGAIGGAMSTIVIVYFLAQFAPEIDQLNWMIITLFVILFSTFGDLTESLFKRQFELKDSSSIFPGHGGVLDRFDSLLFAVPIVVLYIKLIL